jgi:hypothetical protein
MLRGAAWAVRVERQKGASERRQQEAMQNLVFWRDRFEALWRQQIEARPRLTAPTHPHMNR